MIIPIRCFTCNRVLASKYMSYLDKIKEQQVSDVLEEKQPTEDILTGDPNIDLTKDTKYQRIFNEIGIGDRYCCKRHLLTHIDLLEKI
jgi:DNA-directed RNA polymerase subunit N (RpoN/RPB10)